MKRSLALLFALALLTAGAGTASAAAPDGTELGQMTLDPTSGPPETTFTVTSVTDCQTKGPVAVDLTAPGTTDPEQTVIPNAQGEWTADFTVASDAEAGDEIPVDAICRTDPDEEVSMGGGAQFVARGDEVGPRTLRVYETETFEVTAASTTTAAPTTSTPSSPTTEPPATLPTADAAPAVVAQPTLTG